MQRNRRTTVCNYRTTKCIYIVNGADKMDSQYIYKITVPNKVLGEYMCTHTQFAYAYNLDLEYTHCHLHTELRS